MRESRKLKGEDERGSKRARFSRLEPRLRFSLGGGFFAGVDDSGFGFDPFIVVCEGTMCFDRPDNRDAGDRRFRTALDDAFEDHFQVFTTP